MSALVIVLAAMVAAMLVACLASDRRKYVQHLRDSLKEKNREVMRLTDVIIRMKKAGHSPAPETGDEHWGGYAITNEMEVRAQDARQAARQESDARDAEAALLAALEAED